MRNELLFMKVADCNPSEVMPDVEINHSILYVEESKRFISD